MEKSYDVKYYINTFIGVALMFGFGYLPTIGPITPVGMQVIGVFAGTVWCWSTVDKIWPSLLGIVALGMSDYCTIPQAIEYGMKSPILWQMLLMLIVAGGIAETQFPRFVINWLLNQKFAQGRPWIISGIFLYCTYFVVVLVNIPGILLMWSLLYSMAEIVGYQKGDKYLTTMIIGMFLAFMFGNAILPFMGVRGILCAAFANMTGTEIPYGLYMVMNLLVAVISLFGYLLAMKYIFRVDVSKLQGFSMNQLSTEKIKLTLSEKIYVVGFFGGLSLCFVINILPKAWVFTQFLHSLTISGIFAVVLVVLAAIHIKGKPILDVASAAAKSVQWGIIFIVIAVMPITNALTAEETGINILINQLVIPVFGGHGPIFLLMMVMFFSVVLTNLMANLGVGMLILPIIVSVAPGLGIDPTAIALLMIFAVNIAFILPGASPLAGLLHGNEWIKVTDIYRYGICGLAIMTVVVILIIYPLVTIVL